MVVAAAAGAGSLRRPETVEQLTEFGRVRLSRTFFMRDFLFSDIAAVHGMPNHEGSHEAQWRGILG